MPGEMLAGRYDRGDMRAKCRQRKVGMSGVIWYHSFTYLRGAWSGGSGVTGPSQIKLRDSLDSMTWKRFGDLNTRRFWVLEM